MGHLIQQALIIFFVFILLFIIGGFFSAIWVPTNKKDYERIYKLAGFKGKEVFYDLGSGGSGLLFYLSKKYDIKCVGIEVSPILYLYSKVKSLFFKKVEIRFGDFLWHDLKTADVIYVFLLPRAYDKLKNKIKNNTKKDVRIILSAWPFENAKPLRMSVQKNGMNYYLYKKDLIK